MSIGAAVVVGFDVIRVDVRVAEEYRANPYLWRRSTSRVPVVEECTCAFVALV